MSGFPTQVNVVQAPALAGDFADRNPRSTVDFGPGGLVTDTAGVTVGRFAWVADFAVGKVLNSGSGAPTGFVAREQQAMITTFLAEGSNLIPAGQGITLFNEGGFWVQNDNAAGAHANGTGTNTIGEKVFANLTTGQIRFGAAGAAASGNLTGYVETKFAAQSIGAVGELVKITTHLLG